MGRLLGDGGYKCTKYLFTPVNKPKNIQEESYNKVHIKTRNTIERVFGVWKSRFRILLDKMRISRKNAKTLIVALAVLHNLSIMYKEKDFGKIIIAQNFIHSHVMNFLDAGDDNFKDMDQQTTSADVNPTQLESETISRAVYIQRYF